MGKVFIETTEICQEETLEKVTVSHFEETRVVLLADIRAEVVMNEIPDELILKLLPTVMVSSNSSRTAASMAGEDVPLQLIYQRKIERCHPVAPVPNRWDIWHSEMRRQWKAIVPFTSIGREALEMEKCHPALVLFDCFCGQTTADIASLF